MRTAAQKVIAKKPVRKAQVLKPFVKASSPVKKPAKKAPTKPKAVSASIFRLSQPKKRAAAPKR